MPQPQENQPSTPSTTDREESYIQQRLEDQLTWYSSRSRYNQSRYNIHKTIEIISAALIPLLSGMGDRVPYGAWVIGGLGATIAISSAISALHKYHENWITYRTTLEQLKQEKYRYTTAVAPYDTAERFPLLVQRVEGIITKEHAQWREAITQPPKEDT